MHRWWASFAAAGLFFSCGGQTSGSESSERCDFRDKSSGALVVCVEGDPGEDGPSNCNQDAAALFSTPVVASLADGECPNTGKLRGCRFESYNTTAWAYDSNGVQRVESLCNSVTGSSLINP